jgi:hypothetical protein
MVRGKIHGGRLQKKKYNEYRDKLTTSVKYLEDQKDKLNKNLMQPTL